MIHPALDGTYVIINCFFVTFKVLYRNFMFESLSVEVSKIKERTSFKENRKEGDITKQERKETRQINSLWIPHIDE